MERSAVSAPAEEPLTGSLERRAIAERRRRGRRTLLHQDGGRDVDGASDRARVGLVLRPGEGEEAAGGRREPRQLGVHTHEGLVVPGAVLGTIAAGELADFESVFILAGDT